MSNPYLKLDWLQHPTKLNYNPQQYQKPSNMRLDWLKNSAVYNNQPLSDYQQRAKLKLDWLQDTPLPQYNQQTSDYKPPRLDWLKNSGVYQQKYNTKETQSLSSTNLGQLINDNNYNEIKSFLYKNPQILLSVEHLYNANLDVGRLLLENILVQTISNEDLENISNLELRHYTKSCIKNNTNKVPLHIMTWETLSTDTTLFSTYPDTPKIAGFDLDGTLIKPILGKTGSRSTKNVFYQTDNDWQFWNRHVQKIIRNLRCLGYIICIFTNQSGIGKDTGYKDFTVPKQRKLDAINPDKYNTKEEYIQGRKEGMKYKITNIIEALNVPCFVMAAYERDEYRKPDIGMWKFIEDRIGNINKEKSFFIGDAAGRIVDHEKFDIEFAKKAGIKFCVPECIFKSSHESIYCLDRYLRDRNNFIWPNDSSKTHKCITSFTVIPDVISEKY